ENREKAKQKRRRLEIYKEQVVNIALKDIIASRDDSSGEEGLHPADTSIMDADYGGTINSQHAHREDNAEDMTYILGMLTILGRNATLVGSLLSELQDYAQASPSHQKPSRKAAQAELKLVNLCLSLDQTRKGTEEEDNDAFQRLLAIVQNFIMM